MGVVSWNRVLARIVRNPSPLNDARLLSSLFCFVSSWGRPLAILSRVNRPSLFHPPQDGTRYAPSLPIVWKSFRKRARLLVYYETVEFIRYPTGASVETVYFISGTVRGGGVLRGADGRTREETENGYGGRSKILIHNPFLPTADVARFTIPFRI